MSKKVYVIMRNDYPMGVVSSEGKAERIVKRLSDLDAKDFERIHKCPGRNVFYRYYEFELDDENLKDN